MMSSKAPRGLNVQKFPEWSLLASKLTRMLAFLSHAHARLIPFDMVYAIINGMTLRMDRAGRIVLPKPVRERLRLHAGSDLILEEHAVGILLRPVEQRASLVQKQGLLVHQGEASSGFDWDRMIDQYREDRLQDLSGL